MVALLLLLATDAFAQSGVSSDTVAQIVSKFTTKSSEWSSSLQQYAVKLFGLCATLTIAIFGIKSILFRNQLNEIIGQFVWTVFFCAFIFAVINNYQEWSNDIVNGLRNIAGEIGPSNIQIDQPLVVGFNMATTVIDKIKVGSFSDIAKSLGFIIGALIIIVTFALMTAQVVLIKCEAAIVMNASILLLGLGCATIFKEYAINVMRYVLAVAFKLFVMQLVLGLGMDFLQNMTINDIQFEDIIILIGVSVVLLALVKSLPDAIAGVINGSHVSSGSALGQAAAAAAGGAIGAAAAVAGGVMGGAAGAGAVKKAAQAANESGSKGLGKVGQMAGNLWQAHRESKYEAGKVGHMTRMSANAGKRLQEMKMRNMADSGGSGSNSGGFDLP